MAEEQDSFANRIKGAVNSTQDNISLTKEFRAFNYILGTQNPKS